MWDGSPGPPDPLLISLPGMSAPTSDEFRATLGRMATGITVITATVGDRDIGMTVSAFTSLSLSPPMVLVCIDQAATLHDLLADETAFGVNVLAAGQETLSRRFASGDPTDRFAGVGYTRGALGAPLLDGTLAWLECRVAARHPGGDHTIVVGAVAEVGVREERPLLYYRSGYASLER